MQKKLRYTFARFSKCHFNNFSEIDFSKLVPPIWCHLVGSWMQEAVICGYIKKRTLGVVGRGSGTFIVSKRRLGWDRSVCNAKKKNYDVLLHVFLNIILILLARYIL